MTSFTYLPGQSMGTRHQNQMRHDRLSRWERQCDLKFERSGDGFSVIKVLTGVEGLGLTSTQIQLLNGMEELNNRCKLSGLSSAHAIQFAKRTWMLAIGRRRSTTTCPYSAKVATTKRRANICVVTISTIPITTTLSGRIWNLCWSVSNSFTSLCCKSTTIGTESLRNNWP